MPPECVSLSTVTVRLSDCASRPKLETQPVYVTMIGLPSGSLFPTQLRSGVVLAQIISGPEPPVFGDSWHALTSSSGFLIERPSTLTSPLMFVHAGGVVSLPEEQLSAASASAKGETRDTSRMDRFGIEQPYRWSTDRRRPRLEHSVFARDQDPPLLEPTRCEHHRRSVWYVERPIVMEVPDEHARRTASA